MAAHPDHPDTLKQREKEATLREPSIEDTQDTSSQSSTSLLPFSKPTKS